MENNEQQTEIQSSQELNMWADSPVTTPIEEPTEVIENVVTEVTTTTEETIVEDVKNETTPTERVVEVEKIVEKFPEFKDDYSKQIYEAILGGKEDELYTYLSKKNKNYEIMSDVDVMREKLKLDNPTWDDKDIEIEIDYKYGDIPALKDLDAIDKELDPDDYQKAVDFNRSVRLKESQFARDARDARLALNETKKSIELPSLNKEVQVESAPTITQEQIDESNRIWNERVATEMPQLTDFKFKIGDEDVSYKITDEDRASQIELMKNFDPQKVFTDLGWVDKDGNENVLKIAGDLLKLNNFEKIVSSSATQMKTSATKDVLADIKNIDLSTSTTTHEIAPDLGAALWAN